MGVRKATAGRRAMEAWIEPTLDTLRTVWTAAPLIGSAAGERAVYPVCGMTVSKASTAATRTFGGLTYDFWQHRLRQRSLIASRPALSLPSCNHGSYSCTEQRQVPRKLSPRRLYTVEAHLSSSCAPAIVDDVASNSS
jgi:hypothetical protein